MQFPERQQKDFSFTNRTSDSSSAKRSEAKRRNETANSATALAGVPIYNIDSFNFLREE